MQPEINDLLLKLEPLWGSRKIEALRMMHQTGDEKRQKRIEKIAALALRNSLNDSLLNNKIFLPPSTVVEPPDSNEIVLGNVCYGFDKKGRHVKRHRLTASLEDLKSHALLLGSSGCGKTNFAYNLLIQIAGKGRNVVVIDNDRTWRNLLSLNPEKYPFAREIQIYTIGRDEIAPFAWNILFCPPPGVKFSNWLSIVTGKPLAKSMVVGAGVQDFLENEAEILMGKHLEKSEDSILPNLEDIKARIEMQHDIKARQLLWKQSTLRCLRELTRESSASTFSSRHPLKLHEILFERNGVTILELDLEMPSHLKTYLKEAILSYTMLYYLHKGEAEKDEFRTAIFLEEFQSLLPDSKIEFQIGSSMIDMFFRESRKFGVGLIGLSQSALLPVSVLGNAKIVSVFNLATRRDIQEAAGSLFLKQHEIPFIDLLPTGMAIMKIRGKVRNCLVQIPESPIKGKISDKKLKAQ